MMAAGTASRARAMQPVRIEHQPERVFAGDLQRHRFAELTGIAVQWQRFMASVDRFGGRIGSALYGLMPPEHAPADGIAYLCAVEVAPDASLPDAVTRHPLPAGRFALFEHHGHVADMRRSWDAIWREWLPASGEAVPEAPTLFEGYDERFDPATGQGVIELCLPLGS